MKFQRLLFVTLLLSLSLLFIISVEAKPRKKKSTKKHTSKKSKKVADEDNSANEASSDEKTSEDKTSEGESGEEEINSTNSADEEEHGKETLLTTDTKTQEVQKETYIIDFDFDFDNTFFFNLPMLYFRIFINSLPNYLFRALVGRLVPFLLCTGLHEVSVNFLKQRIELNLKLYVAIYCSMEIVAFFRYWNGEVFSTFAQRLFPSLLYQNGSMNFENTLFGIDIYSLFYLSVLYSIVDCIVIEPLFWNIVVAVIIFFISSNCLLNGLPGIRHLNYLVFVGIAGGSGYGYFTLTKPSTSLIMTSLSCILLLVASLINEGASPYTYNPSFFKHFKRYDTPTFFGTLNEIGVGSAAIGMLIHGLKIFGIPLIIFIGLYFVEFLQVGEYTYLILYALYCSTIVGKFVVNNLCKIIIRRNMPFFMYPNGSIFVNTTTLFGFLKMEFVVCIASLIFAHWMTSEVNLTFPQLVTQCVSKGMDGIGFLTNRILVFSKYIDDTDEEGADEEGADEEGADNIGGQIRTWCLSAADLLLPHVLPVNPLGISDLYVTKRQGILQNQATIESFKEGTKSILKVLQGDSIFDFLHEKVDVIESSFEQQAPWLSSISLHFLFSLR